MTDPRDAFHRDRCGTVSIDPADVRADDPRPGYGAPAGMDGRETGMGDGQDTIVADQEDGLPITWYRDPETGAISNAGATIELTETDSLSVWAAAGTIAISRDAFGQTLNVPLEAIPHLIAVLDALHGEWRLIGIPQ